MIDDKSTAITDLASRLRSKVMQTVTTGQQAGMTPLFEAAEEVYGALSELGPLDEIPFMPYTDSRGECSAFDNKALEQGEGSTLLRSAHHAVGLDAVGNLEQNVGSTSEDADLSHQIEQDEAGRASTRARYAPIISSTHLESVEFPKGDYATFLRVRSSLSGALRNVRDQLRQYKNMLDETSGHESGNIDTQIAMQVLASGDMRNDIFVRDEIALKEEAWAILIDASKSTSYFLNDVKGITLCLAEVAKDLIPSRKQWGVYAFNKSLYVIKDFNEPYSVDSKARIGGLTPNYSTLLPDAILSCYGSLLASPAENKIMVVVSDGYPVGYPDIDKSLTEAIQKVSRTGTMLIGVGINNPAIQDFFKVNCVLKNPYQMMKFFVRAYAEVSAAF